LATLQHREKGEDQYRISMAIAGFGPDEIELTQHGNTLSVTGQKAEQEGGRCCTRASPSGISSRLQLDNHVKVVGANL